MMSGLLGAAKPRRTLSASVQLATASSASRTLSGEVYTDQECPNAYPTPRAMTVDEVDAAIDGYVTAAKNAMPLAPLYAALIGADLKALSREERSRRLAEAAASFVKTRDDLKSLSADDPEVARLRSEAQAALDLGTFGAAQEKFAAAVAIDATSRGTLKENFVRRTLSEAATHALAGGAAG